MSASKQVSFSRSSLLILIPHKSNTRSTLWYSKEEITASKLRWSKTIKEVQSMDMSSANQADASDFMGLERYLSKQIQKQSDDNRLSYTQSVVIAQHLYSSHEELAEFARKKTQDAVARSHAVGLFYLNKHFQQEQPERRSKFQESKNGSSNTKRMEFKRHSSDPTGKKVAVCYKFKSFKKSEQRKNTTAPCA